MAQGRRTPGSQTSLREANRRRILAALKKHGGLTQVELAGITGLSAATVSNIVRELTAAEVLNTSPSTRSGRRATLVTLAHTLGLVGGIEISARQLRVAVVDLKHAVVAEQHMPLARDHRADTGLDRASLLLADLLTSIDSSMDEILGVGIAIAAPMVRDSGQTTRRAALRGWSGVPIAETARGRLNKPVFVDNSANLAGLAEVRLGAGRGTQFTLYVEVGDVIGAAVILGGAMVRGHRGLAGEFGHTVIVDEGPLCRCGNRGCVDALASGAALIDHLEDAYGPMKVSDIVAHAMRGDGPAARALADAGRRIGVAVGNACNLLDPERVVIGGALARAGELLIGPIRHAMEHTMISDAGAGPPVVHAQLGMSGAALGAALLAIDEIDVRRAVIAP